MHYIAFLDPEYHHSLLNGHRYSAAICGASGQTVRSFGALILEVYIHVRMDLAHVFQ